MDVYIYTDGKLINGDDADIRLKLPRSEDSILCDDNEQLETIDNEGNERLNILVEEGFDGTNFSRKILSEIRSVIDLHSDKSGKVYRMSNGERNDITDTFY